MSILKKAITIFLICLFIIGGWILLVPFFKPIEEGKNIFESNIYALYRNKLKNFINLHPYYNSQKKDGKIFKSLIEEIEKNVNSPHEQRMSHEAIVRNIRKLASAQFTQDVTIANQESKKFFEDLIQYLFLQIDLTLEMQHFLYQHLSPPSADKKFFVYLKQAQQQLRANPQFHGIEHESPQEDQLLQGNLPSCVTLKIAQNHVCLIRMGQPVCYPFRNLWWLFAPKISPEFQLFLQLQPSHLYINLMKRKGIESSLTNTLETLENNINHLYVITLDKNSNFYWQDEKEYPDTLESQVFKNLFIHKMFSTNGNYYWSKRLNDHIWERELIEIVESIHQQIFKNQSQLNRIERQDFIEITYLAILNHLIDKWHPASMNITCRQGMDRGPSLMALWMLQNESFENKEIAALLLAPPLIIHNRTSHVARIDRFISAAQRLKDNNLSFGFFWHLDQIKSPEMLHLRNFHPYQNAKKNQNSG